jgi:hypothetical protein
MNADDLAEAGRTLFGPGHGSMKQLANALDVSYDSLRHVLSGRRAMPPGWEIELKRLLAGASDQIRRPPSSIGPEIDRNDACADALDPHLDTLAVRAEAAGWHPAEVVAAVISWAAHRAADGAGDEKERRR